MCYPVQHHEVKGVPRWGSGSARPHNLLAIKDLKLAQAPRTQQLASRAKVAGQAYVMADIASISLKLGHGINHFSAESHNPGLEGAFQATSAVGIAAGVTNMLAYYQVRQTAKKVDYVWGQTEATIKMVRGGAEVVSALNVTAGALFDCLTYDGFVSASKASFAAMRGLGHAASAAGGLRYLAVFAYSSKNLMRSSHLREELEKIEKQYPKNEEKQLRASVDLMKEMIEVTEEERIDILEGMTPSSERLTDEEAATLSSADIDFVNERRLDKPTRRATLKEIARRKMGKEKDLSDKTSATLVKLVRAQTRLEGCEEAKIEELQKIVKEAKSTAKSHVLMNALVMVMCVVAIGATVLANIYTCGLFHLVLMGLSLAISGGWLAMDWQMVKDAFKSDDAGKYDNLLRWLVNIIVFAVSGLAIFYTAGTPLLILGIASAALMVSVNLGIWYKNTHVKQIREQELSVRRRVAHEVATGAIIR